MNKYQQNSQVPHSLVGFELFVDVGCFAFMRRSDKGLIALCNS